MMSVDYSNIIKPIRRLLISGSSSQFFKTDIFQKYICSFNDLEKRYILFKKDTEKKVEILEMLLSKTEVSNNVDNENSVEDEVINSSATHGKVWEVPDPSYEAKLAVNEWKALTKEIITLIEEGNGHKVLESLVAASKMECVCKQIIVLCLLLLTKQTYDKALVTNSFSAVSEICASTKLFFLFLQMNKIYSKASKTNGWGRGLRRAVNSWYLHWEPAMLALEISRFPSSYTWSHKDVIKLAHLKLRNMPIGTQVVVHYVFSDVESTKKKFVNEPNSSKCVSLLEMLHIEKNNASNVQKMIERGKLILKEFNSITLADFSTQILNEQKILEFILVNGSPFLVIQSLYKTNLLKISLANKEMGTLLVTTLQKDNFVQNICTLDVLIAYNICRRRAVKLLDEEEKQKSKWMKNAKPITEKSAKVTIPKIPKEDAVTVIEALGTLLVKATESYPKTKKTAVTFIDTSPSLKNYINVSNEHSSSKQIKGIQAISYILLSLASNNQFNIVYPVFFSGTGLEKPSMPNPCSFHFIQTKLKNIAISTVKVKEGLDYACLHKLDTCIMLCYKLTLEIANLAQQSLSDLKTKDPSQQIRLIVCGIGSPDEDSDDSIPTTMVYHPDLLLISGFNNNTLYTISAFHERVF